MSKKEKLLRKLLSRPKDFSYDELVTLLHFFDFTEDTSTSGSAVCFRRKKDNKIIMFMHKPHSPKVLKPYQIKDVIEVLEKEGIIQ